MWDLLKCLSTSKNYSLESMQQYLKPNHYGEQIICHKEKASELINVKYSLWGTHLASFLCKTILSCKNWHMIL